LFAPLLAERLPSAVAGGAPPEGGARAASLDLEDSGGRGAGVVRVPIEPSGRSRVREGRWICMALMLSIVERKAGPERERDIGAFDDSPDRGTRVLEPCGLAAGVSGGFRDDDEVLSHVGTGRPFGPA